ncbi:hypothetical protein Egran_01800 [Elaphomyces granulatus]|uniref:Uncharacterized protein n=1 Tax=Elaphomyces granulatus TaxID=519963 RepID=A0A232M291_9EURO|nr:hypothetical protein Egran_01800 [Elaphomyces granulatus]
MDPINDDLFSVPEPESDLLNAEQELSGLDEDSYLHATHTALEKSTTQVTESRPQPEVLTPLTNARSHPLATYRFEYLNFLPDYPPTHPQGMALVINTRGMNENERNNITADFQYCRKQVHPPKRIYCSYLHTHVLKHKFKCSGLKVCEYLDPALKAVHHEEANSEIFDQVQHINQNLTIVEENPRKRGAFR